LPLVADPSHGTGDAALVPAVARAAVAAGADGIMLEIHPRPAQSFSDAAQALTLDAFAVLARQLLALARLLKTELGGAQEGGPWI
jgi:3-deoxy-7-phosphoheptulonate synthase